VPTIDLGEDKEKDFWKTVYFPQRIEDDSDIAHMFSMMVENNALHLMSDPLKCNIYLSVIV